jgi:Phosphotransferase enzyme family
VTGRTSHAPSLEDCLDPVVLQDQLDEALGRLHGSGQVRDVIVDRVRRNTSRRRNPHPMTLCVNLQWCAVGEAPQAWQFYGKVFRDGASATACVPGSPLHLPGLDMLLWRWPDDPGLPQMATLLQPRHASRWWDGQATQVEVLHYTPESRASLRYADASGPRGPRRVYAKTFSDEQGSAIHQRFAHFWSMAQRHGDAPLVAQPLGYDPQTRTVWQQEVVGEALIDVMCERAETDWLPGVAAAMVAVHRAPIALAAGRRRDVAHWCEELKRRARKVSRAAPEQADQMNEVVRRLVRIGQQLPAFEQTLIHGDCHPGQFLVAQGRPVLFDFDEFACGDPMEDLAEFLVKLDPASRARSGAALSSAYQNAFPEAFDGQRLRWHEAVQQLLQACRAFTFQVPQWRLAMAQRLVQASSLAQALERPRTGAFP